VDKRKLVIHRNKKGQFYLVAALVIIIITTSIVTYRSYIKTAPVSYKVYDLGSELNLETAEVVDYGLYSQAEQQTLMETWSKNFSEYTEPFEYDFVFLYIDENDNDTLRGTIFTREETGKTSINLGDSLLSLSQQGTFERSISGINEVIITINDFTTTISIEDLRGKGGYYFIVRGRSGEVAQQT